MKRAISITLAVIAIVFVAGCQKSPDSPIVVGKNVDLLIDKATEGDQETQAGTENESTQAVESMDYRAVLAEKLGVPERFAADEEYPGGKLTLIADADIILPNAVALPVMRVEPADFSQELVSKLYDYLIGNTPMYQQQKKPTKEQIQDDLVWWRQILNDPQSAEESKLQAEEKIAELEAAYDSAPDSVEMIPADATIKLQTDYHPATGEAMYDYTGVDIAENPGIHTSNGKRFEVQNNNEDGEIIVKENVGGWEVTDTASQGAHFYYCNDDMIPDGDLCYVTVETVTPDSLTERPKQAGGLSYEDALEMAEDFLVEACIEDMKVDSLTLKFMLPEEYNEKLYSAETFDSAEAKDMMSDILSGKHDNEVLDVQIELNLARTVGGIPVTSNGASCYIDDAMFGAHWRYEEFSIDVCSKGIYSAYWSSPHQITETVTEDAAVRTFDEIAEVFRNMYRVTYDERTEGCNLDGEVTCIKLTMRRIMEQDNIGCGLFVPVWDFYGSMIVMYPDYPEEAPINTIEDNQPILTINAIDGSVIDLDKGY